MAKTPSPSPILISSIEEYRQWRKALSGKVGFVPTMGALHEGHATLLREARKENDHVVLSIYVNPAQFGEGEDFDQYPRTLAADQEVAQNESVDAIFFPSSQIMYPESYSTFVEEVELTKPLCGQFRPGHFHGVTTVVLKLLNIVSPDRSYFGLKDAQQFFVIDKMVKDLNLDTQIIGIPTVREKDGLALSSRNQYLSETQREKACLIHKVLSESQARLQDDATGNFVPKILSEGKNRLQAEGFDVQYFDLRTLPTLGETQNLDSNQTYLLAIAAFLGETRLIDNLILYPQNLRHLGISTRISV